MDKNQAFLCGRTGGSRLFESEEYFRPRVRESQKVVTMKAGIVAGLVASIESVL
jgi:hypothetical protein